MSALRDYVSVLARRRWVIIAALIVTPLAALVISLAQQPLYQSTAQIYLRNPDLLAGLVGVSPPSTDPDRLAATQAEIARAPIVAQRALNALGLKDRTADDLLGNSSVSEVSNADLLDFSVTDANADLAPRLATAYARAYGAYQQELDTNAIESARTRIEQRIEQLRQESGSATAPRSPLLTTLLGQEQELESLEALQGTNTSLVQPASDSVQVQPHVLRNVVSGLAIGLILGVGLAFLFDALDSRPRSEKEIGHLLGLPVLARVPVAALDQPPRGRLPMLNDPESVGAEPFRLLRASFEFANEQVGARVVMVTSSVREEGKSFVVANLAVALARAGRRVALIDLNLRNPELEQLFGVKKGQPGLSELALDGLTIDDVLTPIPFNPRPKRAAKLKVGAVSVSTERVADFYSPRHVGALDGMSSRRGGFLELLPTGKAPSRISESHSTRGLGSILADVRERVDLVLIDAPHLLGVGDTIALTSHVDAYIVVAQIDLVGRPMLSELRRVLDSSSATGLGFVLIAPRVDEQQPGDRDSDRPRAQGRASAQRRKPSLATTLRRRAWVGNGRIGRSSARRRS
ncbi:MAG TPA: Wzz/FepE/Etk N-terminal domain-containing protein [Gaiellaceae bacterium]|jgi:Mrp family chromosome partitioning ATPase